MTAPTVTVVDYGVGNLFSIRRAVEVSGGMPVLSDSPNDILHSERIILPGVGAFGDGMAELESRGLVAAITEAAARGCPLLGICLGMQMLLESSEEFGMHRGLGLIAGTVEPIPQRRVDNISQKIPHIGWKALVEPEEARWHDTVLSGTAPDPSVYFVHSFHARPVAAADILATCDVGGHVITAAVQRENVMGCQFHPERSGQTGLSIIRRFLSS